MTVRDATKPTAPGTEEFLALVQDIGSLINQAEGLDAVLGGVVDRVAAALDYDVVSVYLWRADENFLELMATRGLRLRPGRRIRLRPDEGLTGEVYREQQPLAVMPASEHPAYRYFPELGEDAYESYLGVPILLREACLGVLVAQSARRRRFDTGEQTLFSILADRLAAVLEVADRIDRLQSGTTSAETRIVRGKAVAAGVAVGRAVVSAGPYPSVRLEGVGGAGDPGSERARFAEALGRAEQAVADLIGRLEEQGLLGEGEISIFRAHLELLHDKSFRRPIEEGIAKGLSAEQAVVEGVEGIARQFEAMADRYLRDRAHDFRDLGDKILASLADCGREPEAAGELAADTVLVAKDVVPAFLIAHHQDRIAAVVTEQGGESSHTAILAKSLGIPTVCGARGVTAAVHNGETLLVDGSTGLVVLHPQPDLVETYAETARQQAEVEAVIETGCTDAVPGAVGVELMANVGLPVDVAHAVEHGLTSVGLLRSELMLMGLNSWPSVAEQADLYAQVAAQLPGPITVRTLDIGGDKAPAYLRLPQEANPLLGLRSIRHSLEHADLFRDQLRAILRVHAGGHELKVLLPLVSRLWEVDAARELLYEVADEEGLAPADRPALGIMLEAPSVLLQLAEFARRVDFVAVGTNDLTQYLLAVDRSTHTVGHLYSPYHPAVLRALSAARAGFAEAGVPLSVCGDLASQPRGALALLALGYRSLSVLPARAAALRYLANRLPAAELDRIRDGILGLDHERPVRRLLKEELRRWAPLLLELG